MNANSIIDVMLGEGGGKTRAQRFADFLGIASVIQNRASELGVPPESIVSAPGQFNAYGRRLPPGVSSLRSLAQKAWDQVQQQGPIHGATFYATPSATHNLPKGLAPVTKTAGHRYFSDPKGRAIATAAGYRKPGGLGVSLPDTAPTPSASPAGLGMASAERFGGLPVAVEMAQNSIPSSNPERAQRTWERMAPTTPDMMRQAGLLSNPNFRPDISTQPQMAMPSPERFGAPQTETLPSGGTLAYRPDIGPSLAEISGIASAYAASNPSVEKSKAAFDAMRPGKQNSQPGQFDAMLAGMDQLGAQKAAATVAPAPAPAAPQQQDLGGIGRALASVQGAVADQPPGTGNIIDAYDNIGPAMAAATIAPPDTYPDAPPQPEDKHTFRDAMKRAAMGGLVGGLPGALMGLASGMFGEGGIGSGMFDGPGPIDKFSVGSGLKAMERAMSGARGATARASNGSDYTSLGPGMGGFRTSGKYGWTERVGPDGSTRAGGNARGLMGGLRDAFNAGGGLMGDRPGGLGGFFGGLFGGEGRGRSSQKDRDKYSGGRGLY